MTNLDFKTEDGQKKATEIAKSIFDDFTNVEMEFTEYGTMNVTVDDIFQFRFASSDDLLQTKRVLTLLGLKKLDKLTNGARQGNE